MATSEQAADQSPSPNLFKMQGRAAQITYQTSSIAGQPEFTFKDRRVDKAFRGNEIRSQETEIGKIVTVTLEVHPDAQIVTVSVVLPSIKLKGRSTAFETLAILTTRHSGISGPKAGPLQTYRTMRLSGTARLVEF